MSILKKGGFMTQSTVKYHALEKLMAMADLIKPFRGFKAEYVAEYLNIKSICAKLREIADILERE